MSHYETLGVPADATPVEILNAYRKLISRFHPGESNSEEASILRIKEAYEVLSDPKKRNSYDLVHSNKLFADDEDPRDREKRELLKKKKRQELRRNEIRAKWRKRTFAIFRGLSFPILVVAFLLVIDDWLPPLHFQETAEIGWQERLAGYQDSKGELVSHMRTKDFEFIVPTEVHAGYDYHNRPAKLLIRVTPIFKTVRKIYVSQKGHTFSWTVQATMYSSFPWPYLLLFSALFTVLLKNYNRLTYTLCFLPSMIFCVMFVLFWK